MLPAGSGLFDAVTVDGVGTAINDYDFDNDGQLSFVEQLASEENRFNLARGFTGKPTRGMVNINTAPVEVMRALPQMSRLIYNDYFAWDHGVGNHNNNSKGRNRRSAADDLPSGFGNHMHVRFAETIDRYRLGDVFNRDGGLEPAGDLESLPTYADRGFRGLSQPDAVDFPTILNGDPNNEFYGFFPGMRNDEGIVSLGELLTMSRTQYDENQIQSGFPADLVGSKEWEGKSASVRSFADDPYEVSRLDTGEGGVRYGLGYPNPQINESVNADYARERYRLGWRGFKSDENTTSGYSIPVQNQVDARLSTDRNTERLNLNWLRGIGNAPQKVFRPDNVGGDAEEAALLFSGIANMLTTRSDVFTVYFKVRTFSQDPTTGLWDATDKDRIIDESRYMMVIDRSSVTTPATIRRSSPSPRSGRDRRCLCDRQPSATSARVLPRSSADRARAFSELRFFGPSNAPPSYGFLTRSFRVARPGELLRAFSPFKARERLNWTNGSRIEGCSPTGCGHSEVWRRKPVHGRLRAFRTIHPDRRLRCWNS